MKSFLVALQFLTIVPVRHPFGDVVRRRAVFWFPVVGLLIGGLLVLTDAALSALECPPAISAVLLVSLLAAFSGGLHLDGVADTADGLLGSRSRARALEIMRDSRVGSMGVLAVVLVLGLKVGGVVELTGMWRARALLLAPFTGRCLQLFSLAALRYVRAEGGLASGFIPARRWRCGLEGVMVLVVVSWGLGGWAGLGLVGGAMALACGFSCYCRHRLGGFTGDTLGSVSELGEMWVLLGTAWLLA